MENCLVVIYPHKMAEINLGNIIKTLPHLLPFRVCHPVHTLPVDGDTRKIADKIIEISDSHTAGRLYICPVLIDRHIIDNITKQLRDHTGGKEISLLQDYSKEIIQHLKRNPLSPDEIEQRSFELIVSDPDGQMLGYAPAEKKAIVTRVVHATGDFEFIKTLTFHPRAIQHALKMIKAGRDILTDIEMVKTGINRRLLERFGIRAICGLSLYDNLKAGAHETRSEIAIERAIKENSNTGIIAIGNAPTALLRVIDIFSENKGHDTPLIIGVPVGFVKALESKVILSMQPYPFITNLSRKGGTPVAVAIVNALLKIAENPDSSI